MKKNEVLKRRKFTTNTYMKEALEYDILIIKENDLFITIKKYKKMSGKFSIKDGNTEIDYINNGYYVLELTPLNENYNIRYYVNKNKKIIDYYIDISYKNGVEHKIPYYVDLYLDIIHYPKSNTIKFADEDELQEALNSNKVSKRDYALAHKIGNKLFKEIKENKNKYLNIDINKYLDKIK